ncbi:MAG: sugar phosphate isomerase/epimerase, partial [Treponema sp.]|nr:sugar phosphate isomerase/epimerase [Treponema sp.]
MAIGVVGYTTRFRTFTLEQVEATYKKIAELGYNGPENLLGGRAGIPWEEDKKLLDKYGLKVADSRGDFDNPDETKRRADALGVNVLGVASLPAEMWNSVDGFKAYTEKMNKWA